MNPETKIESFEFIVFQLIKWYNEVKGIESYHDFNLKNDLSKLKLIKLHFFVVAINASENNLLKTFDKFYAMPLGHVESDIYKNLTAIKRFNIGSQNTEIKSNYIENIENSFINASNGDINGSILNSIDALKNINYNLIDYSAMTLVEISHSWTSWKETFKKANESGKLSAAIPEKLICTETKIFYYQ